MFLNLPWYSSFYFKGRLICLNKVSIYLRHKESDHEIIYEWPNEKNSTIIELVDDTAGYEADMILSQFDNIVGGYHDENLTLAYEDIAEAQYFNVYLLESQPIASEDENYQLRLFDQLYSGRLNEQLHPTFS